MGLGDYLLKIGSIMCPKCKYQFTMNDLKEQRPGDSGEVMCPRCANKVTTESLNKHRLDQKDQYFKNLDISPTVNFLTNSEGSISLEIPWAKTTGIIFIIGVPVWLVMLFLFREQNPWFLQKSFLGLSNLVILAFGGIPTFLLGVLMFVNKKRILATRSGISYSDGPIWYNNSKQIRAIDLLKIGVEAISTSHSDGNNSTSYIVVLEFKSGSKATLCKLNSVDDAVNIERTLNKYYALIL